jgi:Family of unknown function (DUF6084)
MSVVAAMPRLDFAVEDVAAVEHAAVPTLRFAVRVTAHGGQDIRSVLLDTQIQLAARRRGYDDAARARLFELFGPAENWGTSLQTVLWARTTVVVPPFSGSTVVDVPLPCTYDFDVAAARYLDALADGTVPVELLFSGAVFYTGEDGRLQTIRISWEAEAECQMPVAVWREVMDRHFPGQAWLRLGRDRFERLLAFRADRALGSWDATFDALLEERGP